MKMTKLASAALDFCISKGGLAVKAPCCWWRRCALRVIYSVEAFEMIGSAVSTSRMRPTSACVSESSRAAIRMKMRCKHNLGIPLTDTSIDVWHEAHRRRKPCGSSPRVIHMKMKKLASAALDFCISKGGLAVTAPCSWWRRCALRVRYRVEAFQMIGSDVSTSRIRPTSACDSESTEAIRQDVQTMEQQTRDGRCCQPWMNVVYLPVTDLFYTQDSIKHGFTDGRSLDDLINALLGGDVDPCSDKFLELEAMRYPLFGKNTEPVPMCRNNRRLYCLKKNQERVSKPVIVKVKLSEWSEIQRTVNELSEIQRRCISII